MVAIGGGVRRIDGVRVGWGVWVQERLWGFGGGGGGVLRVSVCLRLNHTEPDAGSKDSVVGCFFSSFFFFLFLSFLFPPRHKGANRALSG